MIRITIIVSFVLLSATRGFSGQVGTISPPRPGTTFVQQRPSDGTPPPGTAVLRGHVTAADTGQPLRKAQVRISASDIRENRMTTADENGAYEFKEVRAARYIVNASKGSYVGLTYGQQRPFEAGKPLEILENQTVEHVDFALPRGSIVTGRVVDEFGEPVPEVQVAAMRSGFAQGRRQLMSAGRQSFTNDLGEFRIFGLPPGQYYVSATWRAQNLNGGGAPGDRTAYAPVYFPGTTNANDARRITLNIGQQIDDLVMALQPVKATKMTGTAVDSQGKPMPGFLQVTQRTAGLNFFSQGAQIRPDGTFTVQGLPPGDYMLRAQQNGPPGPDSEIAIANVTATGEDITGLQLTAGKMSVATGRVIVDAGAAQSLPAGLMLSVFPAEPGPMFGPMFPGRVADDSTFELRSGPGTMRINLATMGATTWRIRAVRLNGIDVTDSGIEFKPNEEIRGLEVEITNKLTTVSGAVTSTRGEAVRDYSAIVFAQDRERWTGNSRYQSVGRPDQDGRFKVTGLPPGAYYIIAVDYAEPGQASDPEFLERIKSKATPFTIGEGETKNVDLRVTTGT